MSYRERYDPVGVQVKITALRYESEGTPIPLCDYDSTQSRHTAVFECTLDDGAPFYRCHEHHPYAL